MDDVGSCGSEQCAPEEPSASSDQFEVDLASIPCVENCKQLLSLGVKAYDQRCYEKNVLHQASKHFSQSYNGASISLDASTSESLSEESNDQELDIELQEDNSALFSDQNEDQEWIPSDVDSALESDDEVDEFTLEKKTKTNSETVKKRVKNEVNETCRSRKKIIDDGVDKNYNKRLKLYKLELLIRNETIADDEKFTVVDGDFRVPNCVWEKLYPYQQSGVKWLWELHQNNCGGIIGDEMGLGKTIQVIAFLVGLSCSKIHCFREESTTLGPVILVCPATVMHQWVNELHTWWPPFRVAILHHTGTFKGSKESLIRNINKSNGIVVTSYTSVVSYQDILYKYNWHYVILDEGHKIRNPDAQVTLACKRFRTPHRLILSGSPIQNNLKELWSLFDFIYPGKLGTLPVFMEQFAVPITQGGYANASDVQVQIAYKCATVLQNTVKPFLLRRVKDDLKKSLELPNKTEQVLFCRLTDTQREMYSLYLKSSEINDIFNNRCQVFAGLVNLRKICNHPHLFSTVLNQSDSERIFHYKQSGKMIVVDALLKLWKKQKHKVLLFTQGKQMLNILESFAKRRDYTYLLMDGSTPIATRQQLDENIFLFLLTTRVGGIGINLTGATRVLIYDPDWNPSTDIQARERAWRIGQHKQVTIYRLLTAGTVEEKIYHRQIFKQYLTNRVLKNAKQQRFFKTNDLYELFTLGSDSKTTESSAIFSGTGSEVKVNKKAKNPKVDRKKEDAEKERSPLSISLPPEKISELREKAKKISEMIAAKFANEKSDFVSQKTTGCLLNRDDRSEVNTSKKVKKGCFFEGKRIKYLVKTSSSNTLNEESNISVKQDEYVLKKLFKKSTMHSALKHDVIEGVTNPDYTIVEKEAEKIANDAIKALKRSRGECFGAMSGVPTWTGLNSRPARNHSSSVSKVESSASLVKAVNHRNKLDQSSPESIDKEYKDMLNDLRSFISFQSKINGQATTDELLHFFNSKLPKKFTTIFKSILWKFCDFHRTSDGVGTWSIKSEFR